MKRQTRYRLLAGALLICALIYAAAFFLVLRSYTAMTFDLTPTVLYLYLAQPVGFAAFGTLVGSCLFRPTETLARNPRALTTGIPVALVAIAAADFCVSSALYFGELIHYVALTCCLVGGLLLGSASTLGDANARG